MAGRHRQSRSPPRNKPLHHRWLADERAMATASRPSTARSPRRRAGTVGRSGLACAPHANRLRLAAVQPNRPMRLSAADSSKTGRWRIVLLGLVPLILLLAAMRVIAPETTAPGAAAQARAFEPAQHFRTVVFILDSAGKSEMFDPALMPFLSSLKTSSLSGRSQACT